MLSILDFFNLSGRHVKKFGARNGERSRCGPGVSPADAERNGNASGFNESLGPLGKLRRHGARGRERGPAHARIWDLDTRSIARIVLVRRVSKPVQNPRGYAARGRETGEGRGLPRVTGAPLGDEARTCCVRFCVSFGSSGRAGWRPSHHGAACTASASIRFDDQSAKGCGRRR